MPYLCTALENKSSGEMAEWSIAAVLKTVELRGSGGSNPSLSAEYQLKRCMVITCSVLYFILVNVAYFRMRDSIRHLNNLFISLIYTLRALKKKFPQFLNFFIKFRRICILQIPDIFQFPLYGGITA